MIFETLNEERKAFENNILWGRSAQWGCVGELTWIMQHWRFPFLTQQHHLPSICHLTLLYVSLSVFYLSIKILDSFSLNQFLTLSLNLFLNSFLSQSLSFLPLSFLLSIILFRWCFTTCPIPYSTVLWWF